MTLEKLKKQALENLTKAKLKVASLYKKLYSNKEEFVSFITHEFEKFNRLDDLKEYNLESIFDLTNISDIDPKLNVKGIKESEEDFASRIFNNTMK